MVTPDHLEHGPHACIICAIAMNEHPLAEMAASSDKEYGAQSAYRVLYDGQCEICQACVSWLKTLDRENKTTCLPISAEVLPAVDSRLKMDDCLRQLHVVTPEGEIHVGWDAVTCLARLFPSTWLIGVAGTAVPLSQCRAAALRIRRQEQIFPQQVSRWRLPRCKTRSGTTASPARCVLVVLHTRVFHSVAACPVGGIKAAAQRTSIFARTYHKRLDLLNGKLTILFLNGMLPNTVPLLFGELFTTVLYDGIAIDPGSPKMRRSLARHLRRCKTENHKSRRYPCPRRTRRQPQLAVRPYWCSRLRFGDDRPVPDAIQEAPVGTRCDNRAASELEAAVSTCWARPWTPTRAACR